MRSISRLALLVALILPAHASAQSALDDLQRQIDAAKSQSAQVAAQRAAANKATAARAAARRKAARNPRALAAPAPAASSPAADQVAPVPVAVPPIIAANAASGRGDYQQAATLLREALAANPRDVAAWSNLGDSLDQLHDPHGASDAYTNAIQLSPANSDVANNAYKKLQSLNYLRYVRAVRGKIDPGEIIWLGAGNTSDEAEANAMLTCSRAGTQPCKPSPEFDSVDDKAKQCFAIASDLIVIFLVNTHPLRFGFGASKEEAVSAMLAQCSDDGKWCGTTPTYLGCNDTGYVSSWGNQMPIQLVQPASK